MQIPALSLQSQARTQAVVIRREETPQTLYIRPWPGLLPLVLMMMIDTPGVTAREEAFGEAPGEKEISGTQQRRMWLCW